MTVWPLGPPGPESAVVLLPLAAAGVAVFVPDARAGGWFAVGAAAVTFALACLLPSRVLPGAPLVADRLEAHMGVLTALSGLAAAWFSRSYVRREIEAGRLRPTWAGRYHALMLAFLGFLLLAATSDDLGIGWVAIEAATIAGVLVVALPQTPHAIEAAWKYVLLCGVGVALALLGIVFLTLAALPALGPDPGSLTWTALREAAPRLHAPMLDLAFVFLLVGYGVKAGLAPLHSWLPDAHSEGPTPVSAVLAGSVLNVALIVLLRLRRLLAATPDAVAPGPAIMALGVASVLLAAFGLWRRGDVKRFFSLSTVEQNGLAAVAIGLGGPLATYAALLQISLHTLAKAAIFQCVGHAAQLRGGQRFGELGGLWPRRAMLAVTLGVGVFVLLGVPPSGLFAARFTTVAEAVRAAPWVAVPLVLGLLVGGWALVSRLVVLCLGAPATERGPAPSGLDLASAWVLLALVLWAGLAPPVALIDWLQAIAVSLS